MNFIPNLDPMDYLSPDPAVKEKFINDLGDTFSNIGFACVKNHFTPEEEIKKFYGSVENRTCKFCGSVMEPPPVVG